MSVVMQQQTIGLSPDDWTAAVPFTQFDPADGTFIEAVMTVTGTIQAAASFENLAPIAATINLGVASSISASADGIGSLGSVAPVAAASVSLPAFQGTFDGTPDFSGPSALVLPAITATQSATTAFVPAAAGSPSPIMGTGTFAATVTSTATATVVANGDFAVELHTSAGATLSLAYQDVGTGDGSNQNDAAGVQLVAAPWGLNPAIPTIPAARTASQTTNFAPATTGWSGDATVTRFDPSLGRLVAILVTANDALSGTFAVENLDSAPAEIGYEEGATMIATIPGAAAPVIASASDSISFAAAAYDGTTDFAGLSGFTIPLTVSSPVTGGSGLDGTSVIGGTTTITAAAALAAFTGTGTLTIPVDSVGRSVLTGPGNLSAFSTQQTGGSLSIQYLYVPGTATTQPTTGPDASQPQGFQPIQAGGALVRAGLISATLFSRLAAPVFLASGTSTTSAQPNQTFVVAPGGNATITGFDPSAGDRLDLSGLLGGANLGPALSDIGSFVGVTGTWTDASGNTVTGLSVTGPSGSASLALSGGAALSLVDLLNDNALVVKGGL
jgi:hypothetical protein